MKPLEAFDMCVTDSQLGFFLFGYDMVWRCLRCGKYVLRPQQKKRHTCSYSNKKKKPDGQFKRTPYLKNGNISEAIVFEKKIYKLKNTCAFDAVIAGIVTAYTDYSNFRCSIDSMDSEFFRFAKSLSLKKSMNKKLHVTRLNLLRQNFEYKINKYGVINIDTTCNVYKIINDYLKTMPSSKQYNKCSKKCSVANDLSSPTIIFSVDDISSDKSYNKLENWIKNYVALKTYPCNKLKCTSGLITTYRQLQDTLFIEVDNISIGNNDNGHHLNDFPSTISVEGNRYTLVSIINFVHGHYNAIIRRKMNRCELHDDLQSTVSKIDPKDMTSIHPHMIMYTKI